MEKPHYNQPITAENIETALVFYCNKQELNFKRGNKTALDKITSLIIDDPEEITSMHDIEAILENDLALVCGQLEKWKIPLSPPLILQYALAANLPLWKKRFLNKFSKGQIFKINGTTIQVSQILQLIIKAKQKQVSIQNR